jgi:hypothetical protein
MWGLKKKGGRPPRDLEPFLWRLSARNDDAIRIAKADHSGPQWLAAAARNWTTKRGTINMRMTSSRVRRGHIGRKPESHRNSVISPVFSCSEREKTDGGAMV